MNGDNGVSVMLSGMKQGINTVNSDNNSNNGPDNNEVVA